MTWAKFGTEFRGQVQMADLSDAAARTHFEALLWLYEIESADLRIPKRLVRTFAGSADYESGVKELVAAGFWRDAGDDLVVIHHDDVYRQSLAAQLSHREKEKDRQRRKRRRDVGTNIGANVRATQSDRQSTKTEGQVLPVASSSAGHEVDGKDLTEAPSQPGNPPGHDGPDIVAYDDQHTPGDGSAGASVSDRYAREAAP